MNLDHLQGNAGKALGSFDGFLPFLFQVLLSLNIATLW
jgi:hypothetical protein